jgi:hypothetical protein
MTTAAPFFKHPVAAPSTLFYSPPPSTPPVGLAGPISGHQGKLTPPERHRHGCQCHPHCGPPYSGAFCRSQPRPAPSPLPTSAHVTHATTTALSALTVQGTLTCHAPGMGPVGQKPVCYCCLVFPFTEINFLIKNSRNYFKIPNFIEMNRKFIKREINLFRIILSRSMQ